MGARLSLRSSRVEAPPDYLLGDVSNVCLRQLRIVREEVEEDYDISTQVLGSGFSGVVRLGTHRSTGEKYAIKSFHRKERSAHSAGLKNEGDVKAEAEVYLQLDHPNICRLFHVYEGANSEISMVMEYCSGFELYHRLAQQKKFSEPEAQNLFSQMVYAVNYLHTQNVVHRDLKLENWMYASAEPDAPLKLIDFGFSQVTADEDQQMNRPCGTLQYASPELLQRRYTQKVDMWSLGVILYMLLSGTAPFRTSKRKNDAIIKDICSAPVRTESSLWEHVSEDVKGLIHRLLNRTVTARPKAREVLEHPWLLPQRREAPLPASELLCAAHAWAKASRLKRLAYTLFARTMPTLDLGNLPEVFRALDRRGVGMISLDDFKEGLKDESEHPLEVEELEYLFFRMRESTEDDIAIPDEVSYTAFLAAFLPARTALDQDKVRLAFSMFEEADSGTISSESLRNVFGDSEKFDPFIAEVNVKGNGVIDFDDFMRALDRDGRMTWEERRAAADALPVVYLSDCRTGAQTRARSSDCVPHSSDWTLCARAPDFGKAGLHLPRTGSCPAQRREKSGREAFRRKVMVEDYFAVRPELARV
jgi:Ca2+-binding EF-hand superfamily protein